MLKNQTAIVTGGGRGIGKEICLELAKQGANVVIAARTKKEIDQTKKMIDKLGFNSIAIKTDVRNEKDVENLVSKTIKEFGSIDILVNNAGVNLRRNLINVTEEEYDEIMDTNVKGVYLCTKHVFPQMKKQKSGKIINIASLMSNIVLPEFSIYAASKNALISITDATNKEMPEYIKVYAVCPAGVDTDMCRKIFFNTCRLKVNDVAEKVLELCLPNSKYSSGTKIYILWKSLKKRIFNFGYDAFNFITREKKRKKL